MIKANELRIGNWYNVGLTGQETPQKFELWTEALDFEGYGSGIPITPEILEKCGFKQHPHFTVQDLWFIELGRDRVISIACVGTPNEMVFITEEDKPAVNSVVVARNYDYDGKTYLHHIQNLYHYFTNGEELNYTP